MSGRAEPGDCWSPRSQVELGRRGTARWRSGHPWIFRDDVREASAANGEVVSVLGVRGEVLGSAFFGGPSRIALRRLSGPGRAPNEKAMEGRLQEAIAYRARIAPEADALRVFSSDADGIPGLIVDRYGEHLVVQALTAGVERRLDWIVMRLAKRLRPISILARNDSAVRKLEGLELETRTLRGEVPETVSFVEHGVRFEADLRSGQKTGAFLDQRENRLAAAVHLRGRVLDAFCYDGAFGLHAASLAQSVEFVDSSESALARTLRNAAINGFTNVSVTKANAFDRLRECDRTGTRFDGIVLDPPAFVKSREDRPSGARAYKEINLRAMKCLVPGGVLVTCSCSYNLAESEFMEIVSAAAADADRHAIMVEKRSQAKDHPVLLGLPESQYLKCLILAVK